MTTEEKALALVNELRTEYPLVSWEVACNLALNRAIEQHEAFKQEASRVMTYFKALYPTLPTDYDRFIIPAPKPDPLVRVINEVIYAQPHGDIDEVRMADDFRAALDACGLEIKEKSK